MIRSPRALPALGTMGIVAVAAATPLNASMVAPIAENDTIALFDTQLAGKGMSDSVHATRERPCLSLGCRLLGSNRNKQKVAERCTYPYRDDWAFRVNKYVYARGTIVEAAPTDMAHDCSARVMQGKVLEGEYDLDYAMGVDFR